MSSKFPAFETPIHALDPRSLSVFTEVARRRAIAFLQGMRQPTRFAEAVLAGYTELEHQSGVHVLIHVAGELSFKEWRQLESSTPRRDPDLPSLVDALDEFATTWRRRAIVAARHVDDHGMRARTLHWLTEEVDRPSRVWRAVAVVDMIRSLGEVQSLACAWDELTRQGFAEELVGFHSRMASVRRHIVTAPLEAVERMDMHTHRESYGQALARWVDARRAAHRGRPAIVREQLGLGDGIPSAPSRVPIGTLAFFGSGARA